MSSAASWVAVSDRAATGFQLANRSVTVNSAETVRDGGVAEDDGASPVVRRAEYDDQGDTDVTNDTLTVEFTESIDPATVTIGSFVLSGEITFGANATLALERPLRFEHIAGEAVGVMPGRFQVPDGPLQVRAARPPTLRVGAIRSPLTPPESVAAQFAASLTPR